MITGAVNVYLEAIVPVTVHGPSGRTVEIDAIIDTGYDGMLSLPHGIVGRLELTRRGRSLGMLADGSELMLEIYQARVRWHDARRRVIVTALEGQPLIGMGLLEDQDLRIEVIAGGSVEIVPLGV